MTEYRRLCRLAELERDFRRGMYQWRHPQNVVWAASRSIPGDDSPRDYCRRLENHLRDLEAADRQRAADLPQATDEQTAVETPLVIRRRGEGGRARAK